MNRELKRVFIVLLMVIIILLSIIMCSIMYIKIKENSTKEKYNNYISNLNLIQNVGNKKNKIKVTLNEASYIEYPFFNNEKLDNEVIKYINKQKEKFTSDNGITYETYYGPNGILNIIFYFLEYKNNNFNKIDISVYKYELIHKETLKDTFIFTGDYRENITNYLKENINQNNIINKDIINKLTNYKYGISNDGIIVYFSKNELTNNVTKITIPFAQFILNIDINIKTNNLNIKEELNYYTDKNKKIYAKSLCNVYESDYLNSNFILNLKKGTKINTTSISNNWYKINYNDNEYYVLKKDFSESIILLENYKEGKNTMYAKENVNVYTKDNNDSEILGTLKKDEEINVLGYNDDYYEVNYNKEAGFILKNKLTKDKPIIKNETNIETNTSSNVEIPIGNKEIDSSKKMVALTFDDGPNGTSYVKILNILEKYNVVATFFDLGKNMKNYPYSSKKAEEIGCEVETHSYSHPNLNKYSVSEIKSEMNNAISTYESIMGHKPYLIRAPYGNSNKIVRSTINMPFIYWTIDTLDWKSRNKNAIINEINKYKNLDGKIILMHSIYDSTAEAVSEIVPQLLKEGYQLVTVAQMSKYKGYTLQNGTIYYSFK